MQRKMPQQHTTAESGKGGLPSAPYPPMHLRSPNRSALSSSPHYTTTVPTRLPDGNIVSATSALQTSSAPSRAGVDGRADLVEDRFGISRQSHQDQSRSSRPIPLHTPLIRFCRSWTNTFACVNCLPPDPSHQTCPGGHHFQKGEPTGRNRKLGPLLLELRKIDFDPASTGRLDQRGSFFTTRTVAVSRGNPSLGTSVASTCLDTPIVQNYSSHPQIAVAAATGLTTGMLSIHTFGSEPDEDGMYSSSVEYFHTARHHRQASAVAWRSSVINNVAIGLTDNSNSNTPQTPGPRRVGGNIRAGGGDREFCCFLWDIEAQQSSTAKRNSTPLAKLSHNVPVASLAWMLDGQTLAVGGQTRTVQLYDMRSNTPPVSAHAHNYGVHGIEVDPHRPYCMATFCRSAGEPVKLWDIRRMGNVVSEVKISGTGTFAAPVPTSSTQPTNLGYVEAVKWSSVEPGMLSVAYGDSVQDYDTNSGSRPVLVHVSHVGRRQRIRDLVLYESPNAVRSDDAKANNAESLPDRLISALYPRRMLVTTDDRTVQDLAKYTYAPVAISRRDGRLVHALGPTVWVGSTTMGPSAMEGQMRSKDEDISSTMMRRARCLRVARYSMDTTSNMKLLSEELSSGVSLQDQNFSLLRVWSWIDRVESLCSSSDEMDGDNTWKKTKGLLDSGTLSLVGTVSKNGAPTEEMIFSETLFCNIFESPARRSALTFCGWAGKFDLLNVLAECESLGEYERSAALAVWHGDIGSAVQALQRASKFARLQQQSLSGNSDSSASGGPPTEALQYAGSLDLLAMCIAGFTGRTVSSVWQSACRRLLERSEFSDAEGDFTGVAYIRAMCDFLLNVGTTECVDKVLNNDRLSLCDRVAFACRFMENEALQGFLSKCIKSCGSSGNIEGLIVTGLSKDGIRMLQSFVDRCADVQTAALIVSRVVLPTEWAAERKYVMEWVEAYRGLLNTWQMWQSRAMFDVDRAEALRRAKAKSAEGVSSVGGKAMNFQSRRMQLGGRRQPGRPPDHDVLASIPAQLDARCNYCSSPLGLRRHEGNSNQWLSKMKPVLSCCPQCRKPLPRCAICSLSLGCLNPYMELTRDRSRSGPRGGTSLPLADDMSMLANLPFAEWFTWCMRCKHGGHAHHMVGWFANHDVCPVSGCECRCQFDGIQKLNRPALSQSVDVID